MRGKLRYWALVACAGVGIAHLPAAAQATQPAVVLPRTHQRLLRSSEGVGHKLYVSLPRGYEEGSAEYPVVYLLDADYAFAIARNVVEHLADRDDIEPTIVVGIAYDGPDTYRMSRTRDYTPTHVATGGYGSRYQAVSGGAPVFRSFIADELIPYMEREYRVSDRRFLVGHSYGGLFASWTAITAPQLFQGFVIVSPSLWYDDGMIFQEEERLSEGRRDLPLRIHMTVGSREINAQHDMVADLRRFAARLEGRGYPGLRLQWSIGGNETHNSIFPRALSDGLRFVLEGR